MKAKSIPKNSAAAKTEAKRAQAGEEGMRASKLPREDSKNSGNSGHEARKKGCDTPEFKMHEAVGGDSSEVPQGANGAKNVVAIPNSDGTQAPNSKAAQKGTEKVAHAGVRSMNNLKCFYCRKKLKRNERALECPGGLARFDFREGEPICGHCLAFLQK